MTMDKALRPKDDRDILYVSRKGRGLASVEDCVDASTQCLKDSLKK